MKNYKIYLLALVIVVIAELIGIKVFSVAMCKIVILPMVFALVIGCLTGPKVLRIVNDQEMHKSASYSGYALMILIAYYGTLVGPNIHKLTSAGVAIFFQELGNLGSIFIAMPVAVLLFGLKREALGGTFSVGREGGLAIVADVFGMDSDEGRGIMAVYIAGTLLGAVFFSLMASIGACYMGFSPKALAIASGVGSASMMTGAVGALSVIYPDMATELVALGTASNTLTALDGLYVSLFIALPVAEWFYRKLIYIKFKIKSDEKFSFIVKSKKNIEKKTFAEDFRNSIVPVCSACILTLTGNMVGYHKNILYALPAILIVLFIIYSGIFLSKIIPGKIPSIAYMVIIGCLVSLPDLPWGHLVYKATTNLDFLSITTPILTFVGISFGKDFEAFKKNGWRLVIVSLLVFVGFYYGATFVAEMLLKLTGAI